MSDPLRDCAGLSADELAQVLELLGDTEVTELDVTFGATRLSVRRPAAAAGEPTVPSGEAAQPDASALAVASPLVGIFRASVASGEAVQAGQSIGAVEALGMPTNVEAPQSGTVEDLLVQDGSPVEYGQPLLILRRAAHAP